MSKQQIGVVGMAVMGRNLALNIESRGYSVSIFNRSREKTDEVVAENPGKKLVPHYTIEEFVSSLEKPRHILLMVQAGEATDKTIASLTPHLDKGDILIDGVTPSTKIPFVVTASCLNRASTSLVPAFPVARRAH